jgi:hypothetical protein
MRGVLFLSLIWVAAAWGQDPARAAYRSPYSVQFSFSEEDLVFQTSQPCAAGDP